jgi:hypothetical protein
MADGKAVGVLKVHSPFVVAQCKRKCLCHSGVGRHAKEISD